MEQRSKYVTEKDVQTKLKAEECAKDMVQRSNYALVKDAQSKLAGEECAGSTGPKI